MIITENIHLTLKLPIDNDKITKALGDIKIIPLRWSITAVDGETLTVNVSYEKN